MRADVAQHELQEMHAHPIQIRLLTETPPERVCLACEALPQERHHAAVQGLAAQKPKYLRQLPPALLGLGQAGSRGQEREMSD